jgi:hypothetical protein
MKKGSVIMLVVLVFAFGCDNQEVQKNNNCSTLAIVRDLTGLDGCGWVFELKDGTKLEPVLNVHLPRDVDYALADFEFVDGKTVLIDYETVPNAVSSCMVGPIVRITCISEVFQISVD